VRHPDAIVIGGGPGGSAAAIRLAQMGHRVTLFETARFPRFHVGESLVPGVTTCSTSSGSTRRSSGLASR